MNRYPPETVEQVLLDFQSVMGQFLEMQAHVLGTYLSRRRTEYDDPDTAFPALTIVDAAAALEAPAAFAPPVVEPGSQAVAATVESVPAAVPDVPAPLAGEQALVRLIVRAIGCPAAGVRASLASAHTIVVTDDERGIAAGMAARLRRDGYRVALVRIGEPSAASADVFTGSLDTPADAERMVAAISTSCGPIAALVHLVPLQPARSFDDFDTHSWRARLALETRTLFLLTQALRGSLETAAERGGAAVVAGTGMGGAFGSDPAYARPEFFPGQGGVAGFTKCLALEWPRVRVRAVDLDPAGAVDALAQQIYDELWTEDTQVEIGYAKGARLALQVVPLPATIDDTFALPSDAVVLATGGARGITAEICLDLAQRYQPTLVLVGQTPLPAAAEPADTADLAAPAELKRALMARLARDGARVTPAMVERAYQQLLREREMRENVGAITAAGARVHYVALDVRDDAALTSMVRDIYETYGRLDGLIHGAGIIEDKLVEHKAVESFDRVFETKTTSAFALSRCVRPESLRFAVFFSSVAGRFGNRGQADYAAANEVVNKLAVLLDGRWRTRVCSINWAPWDKRGMVSPALKREFAQRGIELIEPAAGRRAFWEEIQQRRSDPAEIVVAASARASLAPGAPAVAEKRPLLKHARRGTGIAGAVRLIRALEPHDDWYLNDHRLDGRAVLPLAFATELMVEAAHGVWPDLTVVAVRNLQLFKGIVLESSPVLLDIDVRMPVHSDDGLITSADVEITTPAAVSPALRYRCAVDLAHRDAVSPVMTPPAGPLQPLALPVDEAYRQWTFHGPLFRRITSIEGIGPASIVGRMYSSSTTSGIRGVARADWSIDPYAFDAALQMLLIWSRARNDKTALPSRFRSFRRFAPLSDVPMTCVIGVESIAEGHALRSDVQFVDAAGRVLAVLEGMEASCTAHLNRVTGEDGERVRRRTES